MKRNKEFYKTFAWELVRTNSGQQAYLNATGKTAVTPKDKIKASVSASQLLNNPQVSKYLQQIRSEQRISVTEIVSEIASIIRFDPIDLLNPDGTVKPMQEMPETARKMITSIKINELWFGKGDNREQYGVAKEIKFLSKMDAIEKAMKHLGGYKEDNDQKKATTQIAIFQLPDNNRTIDAVTVGKFIDYEEVQKVESVTGPGSIAAGPGSIAAGPGSIAAGPGSIAAGPGSIAQVGKVNRGPGRGVGDNLGTVAYTTPDIQNDYGPGD